MTFNEKWTFVCKLGSADPIKFLLLKIKVGNSRNYVTDGDTARTLNFFFCAPNLLNLNFITERPEKWSFEEKITSINAYMHVYINVFFKVENYSKVYFNIFI